jgi:hypothetical protein
MSDSALQEIALIQNNEARPTIITKPGLWCGLYV